MMLYLIRHDFANVRNFDPAAAFVHAATKLQNTSRAIGYQQIRMGLLHPVQFLFKNFSRNFWKVDGIRSTETAADILIRRWNIVQTGDLEEFAGFLDDA